jgi:hypothetical protein
LTLHRGWNDFEGVDHWLTADSGELQVDGAIGHRRRSQSDQGSIGTASLGVHVDVGQRYVIDRNAEHTLLWTGHQRRRFGEMQDDLIGAVGDWEVVARHAHALFAVDRGVGRVGDCEAVPA